MWYAPAQEVYDKRHTFAAALRQALPDIVADADAVPLPPGDTVEMFGKHHMHLLFKRGDGSLLLLRVLLEPVTASTKDRQVYDKLSEIATMQALKQASLSVPAVDGSLMCVDNHLCSALESMPGRAAGERITEYALPSKGNLTSAQIAIFVRDVAAFYFGLSLLKFPAAGFIQPDGTVGHFGKNGDRLSASTRAPALESFRYNTQIQIYGRIQQATTTAAILVMLEVEKLIKHPAFDDTEPGAHYIMHAEDTGDQYLLDTQGHVCALIDWEGAFVTNKGQAFSGPQALKTRAYLHGSNELSTDEQQFVAEYENLGRPDLAACVRKGKKYQRLQDAFYYSAEQGVADSNIYALRAAVTGEAVDLEEDWDLWTERKTIEFATDQRLRPTTEKPSETMSA